MNRPWTRGLLAALTVAGLCTATAEAVVVPKKEAAIADKAFKAPELTVVEMNESVAALPALAGGLKNELAALGVRADSGFFDSRSGRWSSLILSVPMIPGTGVGNGLRWDDLGGPPADRSALQARACRFCPLQARACSSPPQRGYMRWQPAFAAGTASPWRLMWRPVARTAPSPLVPPMPARTSWCLVLIAGA